jgi:hypothetical protein
MIPFFQGAAGGAPVASQVFATTLYTGDNTASRAITSGINTSTPGGLVWIKERGAGRNHYLHDTFRGEAYLISNATSAEATDVSSWVSFGTTGFSIGNGGNLNLNLSTYVAWSFARAARFFDVVTYTGNGNATQTVSHSLGTAPGVVICKARSTTSNWIVYHRSLGFGANVGLLLNTTDAATADSALSAATSTTFTTFSSAVNQNGATYVAYLFAHDTASDGIVQCGSYTGNGSATGPTVTLGWRPQFLMIKRTTNTSDWVMLDTARGITSGNDNFLWPNRSYSENGDAGFPYNGLNLTSTGFEVFDPATILNGAADTYVFLAIREA